MRLLSYRPFDFFDVYTCDGLSEYFYGSMVESTKEAASFALRFYYPGMVLLLPGEDLQGVPGAVCQSVPSCGAPTQKQMPARAFCNAKRRQT